MIILFSFSVALRRLSCLGSSKHSCCSRNPFSSQPFSNSLGCYSWEDVPVWKVLGSGRKLWSRALGQRGMTWKCPLEEQHADVLLFQRVSSTGTVSCLYPLSYTSLLSLVNLLCSPRKFWVLSFWRSCYLGSLVTAHFSTAPCKLCFHVVIIWKTEVRQSCSKIRPVSSTAGLAQVNWPNSSEKQFHKCNFFCSFTFGSTLKAQRCEGLFLSGRQV